MAIKPDALLLIMADCCGDLSSLHQKRAMEALIENPDSSNVCLCCPPTTATSTGKTVPQP